MLAKSDIHKFCMLARL